MSEADSTDGIISREDIATLAPLFDQSEFAIDPTSRHAKLAEAEFEDKIKVLYLERVVPIHPEVSLSLFRSKTRSLCRVYLRKN